MRAGTPQEPDPDRVVIGEGTIASPSVHHSLTGPLWWPLRGLVGVSVLAAGVVHLASRRRVERPLLALLRVDCWLATGTWPVMPGLRSHRRS